MRPGIIETGEWDAVEPFVIYVHANNDSYREVELLPDGTQRFPQKVHEGIDSLGYEIELLYMVAMDDGSSILAGVREGKLWLTVSGEQPSEETIRRGEENGAM